MASRLNLADMTTDLNLHPPSYVKMSQLEPPPSPSPKLNTAHTVLKASAKLEMPNGVLANGVVNKDDTTGGYSFMGISLFFFSLELTDDMMLYPFMI